jgi:hypothetical protein
MTYIGTLHNGEVSLIALREGCRGGRALVGLILGAVKRGLYRIAMRDIKSTFSLESSHFVTKHLRFSSDDFGFG